MKPSRLTFAAYSALARDEKRRYQDRRVRSVKHLFTCQRCNRAVPADQAAAHVARCPQRKDSY